MNMVIFDIEELKRIITRIANSYNVQKVLLFGSYFDGNPTEESDVDLLVSYGDRCRGLKRIGFMQELESALGKEVDVLSTEFLPQFMHELDLHDERRVMYDRQGNMREEEKVEIKGLMPKGAVDDEQGI